MCYSAFSLFIPGPQPTIQDQLMTAYLYYVQIKQDLRTMLGSRPLRNDANIS